MKTISQSTTNSSNLYPISKINESFKNSFKYCKTILFNPSWVKLIEVFGRVFLERVKLQNFDPPTYLVCIHVLHQACTKILFSGFDRKIIWLIQISVCRPQEKLIHGYLHRLPSRKLNTIYDLYRVEYRRLMC